MFWVQKLKAARCIAQFCELERRRIEAPGQRYLYVKSKDAAQTFEASSFIEDGVWMVSMWCLNGV